MVEDLHHAQAVWGEWSCDGAAAQRGRPLRRHEESDLSECLGEGRSLVEKKRENLDLLG